MSCLSLQLLEAPLAQIQHIFCILWRVSTTFDGFPAFFGKCLWCRVWFLPIFPNPTGPLPFCLKIYFGQMVTSFSGRRDWGIESWSSRIHQRRTPKIKFRLFVNSNEQLVFLTSLWLSLTSHGL